MSPVRGKFLTIEGTEGVGKSTNIGFIREFLAQKSVPLTLSREPGGTPLAEDVRELLLAKREEKVDETAELLLMFGARAQHIATVIEPALAKGDWVLCDRFTDATYAYQGGGRGIDKTKIESLENFVQGELRPDLTIILDIDVELGLERARQRGELDRFEIESVAFFERVRAAYLYRASQHPERYRVIDAGQDLASVKIDVEKVLAEYL